MKKIVASQLALTDLPPSGFRIATSYPRSNRAVTTTPYGKTWMTSSTANEGNGTDVWVMLQAQKDEHLRYLRDSRQMALDSSVHFY